MSDNVAASGQSVPLALYQSTVAETTRRKHQIRDLTKEINRLKGEISQRDDKIKALDESVRQITSERDGLQERITKAPSELQDEVDRLKGEILSRDHRAAFDRLSEGKIKPAARDAAWKLSGHKPEGEVDEAKMAAMIDALIGANDFLKADPGGSQTVPGGTQSVTTPTRPAGPALTRGGAIEAGQVDSPIPQGGPMRIA